MDGDVQQRYYAAEQAYGQGDFREAESIASTLLKDLQPASGNSAEEEACMAWRAFVALLLGHIHFHGLQQPAQALTHYELALQSQPPDTLRDLAQQGVERCQAEQITEPAPSAAPAEVPTAVPEVAAPPSQSIADVIRDPFLMSASAAPAAPSPGAESATPWATGDNTPSPGPEDSPEVTPEVSQAAKAEPSPTPAAEPVDPPSTAPALDSISQPEGTSGAIAEPTDPDTVADTPAPPEPASEPEPVDPPSTAPALDSISQPEATSVGIAEPTDPDNVTDAPAPPEQASEPEAVQATPERETVIEIAPERSSKRQGESQGSAELLDLTPWLLQSGTSAVND